MKGNRQRRRRVRRRTEEDAYIMKFCVNGWVGEYEERKGEDGSARCSKGIVLRSASRSEMLRAAKTSVAWLAPL